MGYHCANDDHAPRWPALIAVGLFGTAAHVFMERAYRRADASFIALTWIGAAINVAGTTYTTRHEIRVAPEHPAVPGAALAWAWLGEPTDPWTWLGAAVIFTATHCIIRRESRAKRAKR